MKTMMILLIASLMFEMAACQKEEFKTEIPKKAICELKSDDQCQVNVLDSVWHKSMFTGDTTFVIEDDVIEISVFTYESRCEYIIYIGDETYGRAIPERTLQVIYPIILEKR